MYWQRKLKIVSTRQNLILMSLENTFQILTKLKLIWEIEKNYQKEIFVKITKLKTQKKNCVIFTRNFIAKRRVMSGKKEIIIENLECTRDIMVNVALDIYLKYRSWTKKKVNFVVFQQFSNDLFFTKLAVRDLFL